MGIRSNGIPNNGAKSRSGLVLVESVVAKT
jgi:hypothetical protein